MSTRTAAVASRETAMSELALALNANSEAVVMFHAWVAQSMGLDPTAYKTLFVLDRLGPLSAGELSKETGLATASVTNLIDRLVAKGFVERGAHPQDRRRIVVTLIKEGVTGVRRTFGVPNASLKELADRFDARELEIIAAFLLGNAERLRNDLATEGKASPAPQ